MAVTTELTEDQITTEIYAITHDPKYIELNTAQRNRMQEAQLNKFRLRLASLNASLESLNIEKSARPARYTNEVMPRDRDRPLVTRTLKSANPPPPEPLPMPKFSKRPPGSVVKSKIKTKIDAPMEEPAATTTLGEPTEDDLVDNINSVSAADEGSRSIAAGATVPARPKPKAKKVDEEEYGTYAPPAMAKRPAGSKVAAKAVKGVKVVEARRPPPEADPVVDVPIGDLDDY